ncbi:hypothetical protein Dsin_016826 [Dipteronia sinensis]|uniref:Uncharacterized protein n=1 Tax=Dipteronia sinensis TaxID=43782 RepID=A0AAE0E6D6_9ROSI|nr:hypothetical protein Dsin_016826 [Dipteronia sinensis]
MEMMMSSRSNGSAGAGMKESSSSSKKKISSRKLGGILVIGLGGRLIGPIPLRPINRSNSSRRLITKVKR